MKTKTICHRNDVNLILPNGFYNQTTEMGAVRFGLWVYCQCQQNYDWNRNINKRRMVYLARRQMYKATCYEIVDVVDARECKNGDYSLILYWCASPACFGLYQQTGQTLPGVCF